MGVCGAGGLHWGREVPLFGIWLLSACEPPPVARPGPAPAADPACGSGRFVVVAGVPGVTGRNADGLPATETWLSLPQDVTPGPDGTFWVVDYNNHMIREVGADGIARVVVGSGFPGGSDGGPALDQPMSHPTMALLDPEDPDVLWFAATGNHRIGRLSRSDGTVDFPYGTGFAGFVGDGGPASEAWFRRPSSVAFDDVGVMYVSDRMNQVIRDISARGTIDTMAGSPGRPGYSGDGNRADYAKLSATADSDPANRLDARDGRLVLADTGNHVVREIDLETGVIRTLAGTGTPGHVDGPGVLAQFDAPRDVAIAPDGTVYVADAGNAAIRAITPEGEVQTVGGVAYPAGVAVDEAGAVWVADRDEGVILRACEP